MPFSRPREDRGASRWSSHSSCRLLLAVLFGIIDFGFAINRYTIVNNASSRRRASGEPRREREPRSTAVNDGMADLERQRHRHRRVHDARREDDLHGSGTPTTRAGGSPWSRCDLPARVDDSRGRRASASDRACTLVQDQPDEDRVMARARGACAGAGRGRSGGRHRRCSCRSSSSACARSPSTSASLAMERQKLHDARRLGGARRGLRDAGRRGHAPRPRATSPWPTTRTCEHDFTEQNPTHPPLVRRRLDRDRRKQRASRADPGTCNPGSGRTRLEYPGPAVQHARSARFPCAAASPPRCNTVEG